MELILILAGAIFYAFIAGAYNSRIKRWHRYAMLPVALVLLVIYIDSRGCINQILSLHEVFECIGERKGISPFNRIYNGIILYSLVIGSAIDLVLVYATNKKT